MTTVKVKGLAIVDTKSGCRYFVPEAELERYKVTVGDVAGQSLDVDFWTSWAKSIQDNQGPQSADTLLACSTEVECVAPPPPPPTRA